MPYYDVGGGETFTGPVLLPDGSPCTTYSLRSSTQATQGFALGASGLFWCEAGSGGRLRSDGISVGTGSYQFATGAGSTADLRLTRGGAGLLGITDADGTPALNLNVSGAPSLSTCGDGALATGSSNTSGRVVGTTQTACTLTFSSTFGGNSADCWISNLIANRGFVSAASSTAFTVSGLTAGDDFMYFCVGR